MITLVAEWNRLVAADRQAMALLDASTLQRWTRGELDDLAEAWRARHGPPLERRTVVFSEPNGCQWLVVFLGLLKAGAVVAPLDSGEPRAVQEATARARGASFLWTGGELVPLLLRRPHRDARRLVKFTSGSTGAPRAIAFTDAEILADGRQVCATMEITPADVNFGLIPFGHSYGLGNLVVPLLAQGTALAFGSSALPQVLAQQLSASRATVFPAVPALLRALATTDVPSSALAGVRTVISAGAPLAPEIAQAFHARFGKKIHSFYGSTETGGITYDRSGQASLSARSVGRPLEGVQIAFERGGRFRVTSAAVHTLGNRQRVGRLGSYRPLDLAELTPDGELVLVARAGRVVKIAGRRVNLAEVEHALRQIPGVRDAFATTHPERSDALAAAVVSKRPSVELRAALAGLLAAWKIPRKLVSLAEFPINARGKTDARRLQEILGQNA